MHFCFISLEPAKGPTIIEITANSTAFQITWTKLSLDDSNGVIINYEVCYRLGSTVSHNCSQDMKFNVSDVNNTEIIGLKPARKYTVAVRAYTKVGPGPLGTSKSETTNQSRKYYRNIVGLECRRLCICRYILSSENCTCMFPRKSVW